MRDLRHETNEEPFSLDESRLHKMTNIRAGLTANDNPIDF